MYRRPDGGLSRATPGLTSLRFVETPDQVAGLFRVTWGRRLRVAARALTLASLLGAGTHFTLTNQRQYNRPGQLLRLPVAVIHATAPSDESFESFRISQVLRKYTRNPSEAERIAKAVVKEGARKKIDPAMIVGVMLVESEMNPRARSFMGARGLMQVMPFHRGRWGCKSRDLYDIESNICHGVAVLADNIERSPNLRTALQRYNGCVRGRNTPNCSSYSGKVFRARDRTRQQLLAITE